LTGRLAGTEGGVEPVSTNVPTLPETTHTIPTEGNEPLRTIPKTEFLGADEIPAAVKEIITKASESKEEQFEIENVVTKVLNNEILDTQTIRGTTEIKITSDKITINGKVAVPTTSTEIIANIGDGNGETKLVTIETNKESKITMINDGGLISYSTDEITILGKNMYFGTYKIAKGPSAVVRDLAMEVNKIELKQIGGTPTPTYTIEGVTYRNFIGFPIPMKTTVIMDTTGKELWRKESYFSGAYIKSTGQAIK